LASSQRRRRRLHQTPAGCRVAVISASAEPNVDIAPSPVAGRCRGAGRAGVDVLLVVWQVTQTRRLCSAHRFTVVVDPAVAGVELRWTR